MHFKNALNAPIYAVSRAFFTQFLAKFRISFILPQKHTKINIITAFYYFYMHNRNEILLLRIGKRVDGTSRITDFTVFINKYGIKCMSPHFHLNRLTGIICFIADGRLFIKCIVCFASVWYNDINPGIHIRGKFTG